MNEVTALERQLTDAKQLQRNADMAERLFRNADFKTLILDGFCRDDCARYAQLSADPAMTAEQRDDALALAQAAGHLRRYLSVQIQMAPTEAQLEEIEEMIVEARIEADTRSGDDA